MTAPQYPAGPFHAEDHYGPQRLKEFIAAIETAPDVLRRAVADLSDDQLDTRYNNWTIRQNVHHLADSHVNSFIRFKWALTWVQLLRCMSEGQFARSFIHPETGNTVTLYAALSNYAWHCRHHTGQIMWLREQHGW